jgi:CRISPR-associated protein Cmr1
LKSNDFTPKDADDLASKWKQYMPGSFPVRDWPTLAACLLIDKQPKGAIEAWDQVIELMKRFRQGVDLGRNPGQQSKRPGRSRWPEPETIRRGTRTRAARHQRMQHIPDDAFPRAELGLPIVFQFKDERQGDPPNTVLYPDDDRDRMASPLILKPMALANGKAIPIILRLKTPPLTGVDLRQGHTSVELPSNAVIRDPKLATYQDSPMQNRSNEGSALEAFLNLAQSKGYAEVTR